MKIFAKDQLREMRIRKGLSTVDLAKLSGLSKQMIGQIERKANGVSPSKSQDILNALEVEFDDVFELVERENAR